MKCQFCEKPATFHITELTGPEPQEVHLCEDHVQDYLSANQESSPGRSAPPPSKKHLKIAQTGEELARLDKRTCPKCGITFQEFRQQGRLGCPHDYTYFAKELEPLLLNIHGPHGEHGHVGKHPPETVGASQLQAKLTGLQREMREAVQREDYERASQLRDEIKRLETET